LQFIQNIILEWQKQGGAIEGIEEVEACHQIANALKVCFDKLWRIPARIKLGRRDMNKKGQK
jgi:hypothetical protein